MSTGAQANSVQRLRQRFELPDSSCPTVFGQIGAVATTHSTVARSSSDGDQTSQNTGQNSGGVSSPRPVRAFGSDAARTIAATPASQPSAMMNNLPSEKCNSSVSMASPLVSRSKPVITRAKPQLSSGKKSKPVSKGPLHSTFHSGASHKEELSVRSINKTEQDEVNTMISSVKTRSTRNNGRINRHGRIFEGITQPAFSTNPAHCANDSSDVIKTVAAVEESGVAAGVDQPGADGRARLAAEGAQLVAGAGACTADGSLSGGEEADRSSLSSSEDSGRRQSKCVPIAYRSGTLNIADDSTTVRGLSTISRNSIVQSSSSSVSSNSSAHASLNPLASVGPPRPPKPQRSWEDSSDTSLEPADYLVPDGVPPVPSREPLSPTSRRSILSRSLPPHPSAATSARRNTWFKEVDREGARDLLMRRGNGAFLVRPSKSGGPAAPFALSLIHDGHMYNFNVRLRSDGRFAVGYEKRGEASFASVEELVRHHQREPISLPNRARTCLTWYPSGSPVTSPS